MTFHKTCGSVRFFIRTLKLFLLTLAMLAPDRGLLAASSVDEVVGRLAIQNSGRVKPLDTFARETLQLMHGKRSFNDKTAIEVLLTWYMIPMHWNDIEFIKIQRKSLKESLGLDVGKSIFSPSQLTARADRIQILFQELSEKRTNQEKLNPYFQDIATLESQVVTYQSITNGKMLRLVPPDVGGGTEWRSIEESPKEVQSKFDAIAKGFVSHVRGQGMEALEKAVIEFEEAARAVNPTEYPTAGRLNVEYHYNHFHPFMISWVFYLLSVILFLVSFVRSVVWIQRAAWICALLGLGAHIYGFALRIYLTERPPVSNMYETVIWVSFGAIIFGMYVARRIKSDLPILAGCVVCVISLILGDLAPAVLDDSLQPLQPVLRSTLWLTVHVLTITLSYAAFFVAFILGDIGLIYYLRDEKKFAGPIKTIAQSIYRCVQIGVVLLAAGTILGGVWADYSWGRFWGWDPKETWALIALLGYVAVLHGRLAGWLRDFGFMMSAIVAFSLVLMAWYGVNFVLGAGLHSYGFGGGGVVQVSAFVAVHVLAVIFTITVRNARLGVAK